MTLSEYIDALRRGWMIVLSSVVVVVAIGAALVLRQATVYYTSTALFVAPASTAGDPDLVMERAAVLADRVTSYVSVVSGDLVRDQVSEEVGGLRDAGVSVTVPLDTVVVTITVSSADAEHAAAVAAAYADVATEVIEDVESPDGDDSTVTVTTIDRADVPSAPVARSWVPTMGAALVLGLGLGLTLALLQDVLRRERVQRGRSAATSGAA